MKIHIEIFNMTSSTIELVSRDGNVKQVDRGIRNRFQWCWMKRILWMIFSVNILEIEGTGHGVVSHVQHESEL